MTYILDFYRKGLFTKPQMQLFVRAKFITADQYGQVVGDAYATSSEAATDTKGGE